MGELALYLMIITSDHVAGAAGPINPLTMQYCLYGEHGAASAKEEVRSSIALKRAAGLPIGLPGNDVDPEDINFGCVFASKRPVLGSPASLFDISYPTTMTRPAWLSE
jgi:hypothetical protein